MNATEFAGYDYKEKGFTKDLSALLQKTTEKYDIPFLRARSLNEIFYHTFGISILLSFGLDDQSPVFGLSGPEIY